MHSVHRSRVLAEIRKDLAAGRPCRVVSTSLIEAGVDVDFPLVLRASAGLDQIAQAAGRCNREFKHGVAQSEVLVFEAAAYGVIQALKANAEAGAEMLGVHADDPLSPAAIEAFFNMLYWRKTHDELDKGRVLRMCNDHKGDLDFPFETIAREMRFIDDAMLPVIVACEEEQPGQVAALVRDLRFAKSVGGIARKLGRYTVGVPRAARSAMVSAKVAETIRAEEFGDQFVVLHNLDLYRPDVGLDWSAPTFRSVESLMSC
jgi:CRISPR-associated endonuclease/helicase Cas3